MSSPPDHCLFEVLEAIARRAGQAILALYGGSAGVRLKGDSTPVTEADLAADRVIAAGLAGRFPDIPVISEESVGSAIAPPEGAHRFFLVDPLDGTREFLERTDEFTVNIALIESTRSVAGIVYAPALDECYVAAGGVAWFIGKDGRREGPLRARAPATTGSVILASRFHRDAKTDAFIASQAGARVITAGSALKFGVLARGAADLYPRHGRTMEWDTAAGHAVLAAAGGSVRTFDGVDLAYGKPGFANPGFVARGLD
ncbi:MAG: 3'(2'),5'-bisphosphate nucleotidase CysQ [Alphaproteobacteria bacterium]|nr:3'(2'),5'-bisphosphate nucleotidase CysQ [Alphaproteobacteria bacterium]